MSIFVVIRRLIDYGYYHITSYGYNTPTEQSHSHTEDTNQDRKDNHDRGSVYADAAHLITSEEKIYLRNIFAAYTQAIKIASAITLTSFLVGKSQISTIYRYIST